MGAGTWTRTSRVIRARPEELYAAFLDPAALVDWLPPAEMTGRIHEFDARVGGGYRMSLFYPPDERTFRGKTSDREDMVVVRFMELASPRRIVEAVSFVTNEAGSRLSLEQLAPLRMTDDQSPGAGPGKRTGAGMFFRPAPYMRKSCSIPSGTVGNLGVRRCVIDVLRPWAF